MLYRKFSLAVAALAVALFVGVSAQGQDKDPPEKDPPESVKNSHTGKFVSAKGKTFKMEDKGGKEHSHTLAADAKILGPDGKECRIEEMKRGQVIRVTTKEGDRAMVTKVEAMKPKTDTEQRQ